MSFCCRRQKIRISIHVPRVENDSAASVIATALPHFNPRPPCGGRLAPGNTAVLWDSISIHVPRVEDDAEVVKKAMAQNEFQSTSPVWRTTSKSLTKLYGIAFQSTSPVWRTTYSMAKFNGIVWISIHVPRVEDDSDVRFFPRFAEISIHVPRVEDDAEIDIVLFALSISIHVPRVEDDRQIQEG